ncbi:hypothetical protein ELI02_34015 [Rhizobium leguminosarum]|uniref:hypothetical protein n=1 Tax=Rhizobium leguminosarum TaxID=384 RepID=UPI00103135C8|nr:hypothetical protein [Rhizobium leguminosarum]TAX22765.1 hypothetical protein ELI04_32725 [Rhizobium leguminosarum]TAX43408.1 hypothetical protein ELI02_34015 [Rhizobium leguminosarum]
MAISVAFSLVLLAPEFCNAQYNPYYYGAPSSADPGELLKSAEERVDELVKTGIPKNDLALTREIDSISQEIANAGYVAGTEQRLNDLIASTQQIVNRMKSALDSIKAVDCKQQFDAARGAYGQYGGQLQQMRLMLQNAGMQDVSTDVFTIYPQISNPDACIAFQQNIAKPTFASEFTENAAKVINSLEGLRKEWQPVTAAYLRLLDSLQKRKNTLTGSLNDTSAQQQISVTLPYILAILAASCIIVIALIKFFSDEIQMEWVASGQVIQFITVMILLSVITALGISNILHENTLGTLLGGIAGYVLAQGVGRAAARDISRAAGLRKTPTSNADSSGTKP